MIINDKIVIVYDIEVFPNVFSCTTKNTENGLLEVYEISNRKNDVYELIELFKSGHLMCGYNNHHYDDAIMNFILMYEKAMCSTNPMKICRNIAKLSNIIITSGDDTSQWKEYKYAHLFESFDLLTMLFSSKLRVGLKEISLCLPIQ